MRESQIEDVRARLTGQMAGGLTDDQRTLAAAIIDPLIVANSFFSADLTELARAQAAAEIEPQTVNVALNEALVRRGDKITEEQLEVIDEYGLRNALPDVARLGGWLFLSILVVGLGLAWIWRFRRELWHRTNALLLIGLLVVGTTLLLKATADRPASSSSFRPPPSASCSRSCSTPASRRSSRS